MKDFLKKSYVFIIGLLLVILSMKIDLLLFFVFGYFSFVVFFNLSKIFIVKYTNVKLNLKQSLIDLKVALPLYILLLLLMLLFKQHFFIVFIIMILMGILIFKEMFIDTKSIS